MTMQTIETPIRSLSSRFGDRLMALMGFIGERSAAAACARQAEALFKLSDEDLAKRGLRRDEVIQHAFARYLYI
jgi:hypothetical protein